MRTRWLVRKVSAQAGTGILIEVEIVDSSTGWQLWAETSTAEKNDVLLFSKPSLTRLWLILKLKLIGEDKSLMLGIQKTLKLINRILKVGSIGALYTRGESKKPSGTSGTQSRSIRTMP